MKLKLLEGTVIEIDPKPFASGGEGSLHEVQAPTAFEGQVAKIYHPKKRSAERAAKIDYLIQYPPQLKTGSEHRSIIWPTQRLQDDKGDFIGFLMPFAEGEKLEILCSAKIPRQIDDRWRRLAFSHPEALRLRLKVCYNLAIAVAQIHAVGRYVLVDLKPDNVLITSDGLLSIVDTDSLEVREEGKLLHGAAVATPEFTPPEYYRGVRPGEQGVGPEWDYYSLAIIFYKLLCGIHPAAGSCGPPFEEINSLGQAIEEGLYPHIPSKKAFFTVIPPLHRRFERLDDEIQSCFIRCLEAGHEQPSLRPTANDWAEVLSGSALLLVNRKLPSHSLELSQLTDINWFDASLSNALEETQLKTDMEQRYGKAINTKGWRGVVQDIALKSADDYRQIFVGIWLVLRFMLIMLGGIGVFALVGGLLAGSISFLGVYIDMIIKGTLGLVAVFTEAFLLAPPFLLLLFAPVIRWTSKYAIEQFRKATKAAIRRAQAATIVTDKQQERFFEREQYRLFEERIRLRKAIEEKELLLQQAKDERYNLELDLKKRSTQLVDDISTEVRASVTNENKKLLAEDKKVKALAAEEAQELKTVLLQYQEELQADAAFAAVQGNTIRQKLEQLGTAADAAGVKERLEKLQQELSDDLQAVRQRYDEAYEGLTQRQKRYRARVDELSTAAVQKIQLAAGIKKFIKERGYREVLRKEIRAEQELEALKVDLDETVSELREVRRELKRYRN